MSFSLYFAILGTFAWLLVYVECIRLGFKNKLCYMPLYALALNLPWEAIACYYQFTEGSSPYFLLDFSWLLLDIPIVYLWFKYGRSTLKEANGGLIKRDVFIAYSIGAFLVGTMLVEAFVLVFGWGDGMIYIAQLMILLMAIFITHQCVVNKDTVWTKRMTIFKFAGDLLYYVAFAFQYKFILYIAGICLLLDFLNVALVSNKNVPLKGTDK